GAPDIIVRNEKRMLQEAVDALIDNGRRGRPVTGPGNRALKSLSDMLKGKQGRFRQNLLGKRVDYSGRSVIVVGPELKMYQCGLPKEMALELFKPFVMKKLVKGGLAQNVKGAKRMVERGVTEVWGVLEDVIKDHPVMLNRAPTLHRLGIQAFEPVLVEGRAIKLHPLVCTAFNADFDGDQMAVHVPLSVEAQSEARFLMLASNNILKPQDGKPVVCPTQDMVMGCYYLTQQRDGVKGEGKAFSSEEEAIMAYQTGEVALQAKVKIRLAREWQGETIYKICDTSVGRVIFNNAIPQDLGFVERNCADDMFKLEIDSLVKKKDLGKIVDACYRKHGPTQTSETLDRVKKLGYSYSTRGGVTVGFQDIKVPAEKKALVSEAEKKVVEIDNYFRMGLLSNKERRDRVIKVWEQTTEDVTKALMDSLDAYNPIFMMADSGARGSQAQIRQLAGMRGLMADPSGQIIEVPIRANFREGLSVLEFFISSHGARKGLADTALRTADSGYLTRRLVDVSQDVIVRENDCFAERNDTPRGMWISAIAEGNKMIEPLSARIEGRYAIDPVFHPETGEQLCEGDHMISHDEALAIETAGVKEVYCRSVFTCRTEHGVCCKCYGANLATGGHVDIGEAVGIIAAQAIGEPGTQLTMRTFHTGGVASSEDITQGLPRVEELFEARKPKGLATITEISGTVRIDEAKHRAIVTNEEGESENYLIPFGSKLKVKDDDHVEAGDELTEGSVNPNDILKIKGVKGVQAYLLKEVQSVYRLQGVEISDKHIEVIIRQMLRKVQIEDAGDTNLLPGELCDIFRFEEENEKLIEQYETALGEAQENGTEEPAEPMLAKAKRKLLGITKAALATESFLSAASFQETTRVLTEAAIKGKIDPLVGLKENVIIGKLIPAGIGLKRYRNVEVSEAADLPLDAE
ncbi:MAG: DNA-directed RNA polymerase subunit beta', partial [Clostridia bacterium]|nr:DNA-directed RNA polymerase subunit beta' [Clostridia bacterium]